MTAEHEPAALEAFERRARRAYERARLSRALAVALPLVALAALVFARTGHASAVGCGAALCLLVPSLLYVGGAPGRAAARGTLVGIVPLGLALAAQAYGHMCTPGGCVSLCVPACLAGGLFAGFMLARAVEHERTRWPALALSAGFAGLAGSMGCACVGAGGVLGLAAGLAVGAAARAVAAWRVPAPG
jgi:hypothetical protein